MPYSRPGPIGLGAARRGLRPNVSWNPTFVVVGTDRDRKTGALRALLAHNDGGGLHYAGAAFIALAVRHALSSLAARLEA